MNLEQTEAQRYVSLFETLSQARIDEFDPLVTDDMHFRDPFSDVHGRNAFKDVLHAMYGDVEDPKFQVLNQAWDQETLFLKWRFTATVKRLPGTPWEVFGMTELRFAADGRIQEHLDYWDAAQQFYERLPVLGAVLRWLRRRIGTH